LPISLPPLPGELLISYVRRLAVTNHTHPTLLISHLGRHESHPEAGGLFADTYDLTLNRAALDRLAVYSDSPSRALLNATRTVLNAADWHAPTCRWAKLTTQRLVRPCTRCTKAAAADATIALTEHQPGICSTHHQILARPDPPIDRQQLGPFPEIAAASRRHRRLRRRRNTFTSALRAALQLTANWRPYAPKRRSSPEHLEIRWQARAMRLGLPNTDDLVRYPETIALADLLSTLPWPPDHEIPGARPIISAPVDFLAQAARYLHYPAPRDLLGRGHPLCRWVAVPEGPAYWWRDYASEPDRTAYFLLRKAKTVLDRHRKKGSD
jgi:hypothetical protein